MDTRNRDPEFIETGDAPCGLPGDHDVPPGLPMDGSRFRSPFEKRIGQPGLGPFYKELLLGIQGIWDLSAFPQASQKGQRSLHPNPKSSLDALCLTRLGVGNMYTVDPMDIESNMVCTVYYR